MIDINQAIAGLSWQREPQGLYAPIAYTLEGGGKRLRPTLAMIACRMYDGDEHKALPVALALEIFHNFTLLHDDVMDQAPVRRGRPTVHTKWDNNTAILSGDQMMTEAYIQLETVDPVLLPEVLHRFNGMAEDIWRGQQLDIEFERRSDVTLEEYLEMIRLKTSVLLGAALQLGGLVAGAPEADVQRLYRIGERIGLAFQIQDDVLDVWGDEKTFGKRIGGDIVQNKKSAVQLLALMHADEAQRRALTDWLNRKEFDENEKIREVTALYNAIQIRPLCEEMMAAYTDEAMRGIDNLGVPDAKKNELRDLTRKLLNRKN
jgi:geranylgeranyl diphosphate synthase type II